MANTHSLDLELSSSQYAYITDGDQTGLDITGDITLEAWIKLEQLPSNSSDMTIASKYETGGTDRSWRILLNSDGDKLNIFYSADGSATDITYIASDVAFVVATDVGNWVHVAIAVDVSAKTTYMYKNTVLKASSLISGTQTAIHNGAAPFIIGAYSGGANLFDGLIDEVRLWNDIRNSTEISDNYQKELVGNEAGLVGYWKFNNSYLDETSNDNDLTGAPADPAPVFSDDVPFVGTTTKANINYFYEVTKEAKKISQEMVNARNSIELNESNIKKDIIFLKCIDLMLKKGR